MTDSRDHTLWDRLRLETNPAVLVQLRMQAEAEEFLRVEQLMRQPHTVFVFGSNLLGIHGRGAAKTAKLLYGAVSGVDGGNGLHGRSYAIPTKLSPTRTLPVKEIALYVAAFVATVDVQHRDKVFVVTRVGCGNAGYTDAEMAPLFKQAPPHCLLPLHWRS